jgi:hypothetical protein
VLETVIRSFTTQLWLSFGLVVETFGIAWLTIVELVEQLTTHLDHPNSRRGDVQRVFRLSVHLITFETCSAHLAYLVQKGDCKNIKRLPSNGQVPLSFYVIKSA